MIAFEARFLALSYEFYLEGKKYSQSHKSKARPINEESKGVKENGNGEYEGSEGGVTGNGKGKTR